MLLMKGLMIISERVCAYSALPSRAPLAELQKITHKTEIQSFLIAVLGIIFQGYNNKT